MTPGGVLCAVCAEDDRRAAMTEVFWRPDAVIVLSHDDPSPEDVRYVLENGRRVVVPAVWRLPKGIRLRAWLVAKSLARITTARLVGGWSLAYVLKTAALGRDQIAADLAAHGHPMDRKTVGYMLDELADLGLITRTGQLPAWTDPDEQDASRIIKSGARLWALTVEIRTLGQAALALALKLRLSASLGGIPGQSRAEKALRWALDNAQEGKRNHIGAWLACRCKDAGLTEDDADHLLRRYVAGVDQAGHRYTLREATRTFASVYRTRAKRVVEPPPSRPAWMDMTEAEQLARLPF